jgi:hypothetical protein
MFQKYEDLDVLVSKLDDATLMQLKDELDSVADDLSDGVLESVNEVHEDVESDETELDRMLYLGGVMGSSSNNIMIKENSEVPVQEAEVQEENMDDKIMFKGKQVDMNKLDYKMQDVSDGMFTVNAPVFYTDGSEVADEDMEALEGMTQFQDWVMTDYTNESVEEASVEEASVEEASVEVPVQELQDILQLAGFENYAEKIEEYANEPNEEYGDSEEQMVGLSGGLNGPKTHYPAAAGGDNPMNVKPLKVDDVYESFYTKYDKFIAELNNQNK